MTAVEVAARCDPRARRSGAGYTARCPAHADRSPSLAVREGRDGRVLVRCWAGCETAAVLAAAGLAWRDICGDSRARDRAEMRAGRQRQTRDRHRHARLATDARNLGARIRGLGQVEMAAVDRVRDLVAGAPERWPAERQYAAWAAAELGSAVARLVAEHDALLDRLYPRPADAPPARQEVAA